MSVFRVQISVGGVKRGYWRELSAVVDTSSPLSFLPGSVLRELKISPAMTRAVTLPDGARKEIDLGYAWLKLNEREAMTHFAFASEDTRPFPGRVAINSLLLEFDSVNQQLVPMTNLPL